MKTEGIWRKKNLFGSPGKNLSSWRFCFLSARQWKERALSLAMNLSGCCGSSSQIKSPGQQCADHYCQPRKEDTRYTILSYFPGNLFNFCSWKAGGEQAQGVHFWEEGVNGFLGIHFTPLLCRQCMGFDECRKLCQRGWGRGVLPTCLCTGVKITRGLRGYAKCLGTHRR